MSVHRAPRDLSTVISTIEGRVQRLELRGRGFSVDTLLSGVTTYAQDNEPAGGDYSTGDLWFDTDDGNRVYRWNGDDWIEVVGTTPDRVRDEAAAALVSVQDNAASVDGLVTTYVQAGAPGTHVLGDLWIDTDDNMLYRWSGTSWVSTGSTTVGEAVTKEQNEISYADGRIITKWQPSEPVAIGFGDLWVDTLNGNTLRRWNNFDWVVVLDWSLALVNDQLETKISTFRQGTIPTSFAIGDIWVNTADGNKQYRAESVGANSIAPGEWVEIQDEGIQDAIDTAGDALDAAGDAVDTAGDALDTAGEAQDDANKALHYVLGKNAIYRGPSEPTPPLDEFGDPIDFTIGDLWMDSDDGNHLYIWDGTAWTDAQDGAVADAAAAAIAALGAAEAAANFAEAKNTVYRMDDEPTPPSGGHFTTGDLWFDTNDGNHTYIWDGSDWVDAQDLTIQAADAAAQAAADAAADATQAASDAIDVARAKNQVYYQDTAPTSGPFASGDTWFDTNDRNRQYKWDTVGSAWVDSTTGWLSTNNPGSFPGVSISSAGLAAYDSTGLAVTTISTATGLLTTTGGILTGGEIAGALVTGGTIQTTTTPSRGIKLTTAGLTAYSGSGASTFTLTAATGAINMTGPILTGGTVTGAVLETSNAVNSVIRMNSTGIYGYNSSGSNVFALYSSTGNFWTQGSSYNAGDVNGATVTGGVLQTDGSVSPNQTGIKMNSTGLIAYSPSHVPTFSITAATGAVSMLGTLLSGSTIQASTLTGTMTVSGGTISGGTVQTATSTGGYRAVMETSAGSGLFSTYNGSTFLGGLQGISLFGVPMTILTGSAGTSGSYVALAANQLFLAGGSAGMVGSGTFTLNSVTVKKVQTGTLNVTGGGSGTISYSGFTGTPNVVATTDTGGYIVSIGAKTSSSCNVNVIHRSGTGTASVTVNWIAVQP